MNGVANIPVLEEGQEANRKDILARYLLYNSFRAEFTLLRLV
jgi:hypothetical protein